ncbi:MAG TPA: phospholipase A, partial [Nevskiaceae bacterium]|nr:phospholipase A [Nevskiaceae bacterium]
MALAAAALAQAGRAYGDDDAAAAEVARDAKGPPLDLKLATTLSPREPAEPRSLWKRLVTCDDGSAASEGWLRHLSTSASAPSKLFGTPCDVSWYRPTFILPYTYSPDYDGHDSELLFQVSAKLRLLGLPLYFGYTQRSFWSVFDSEASRPFRETVYEPELFYRWVPYLGAQWEPWGFGADIGAEHESNGRDLPRSRSWNRVYLSPFFEKGGTAVQLKTWYRVPEDEKKDEDDATGDDNPDIDDYLGWTQLDVFQRFGKSDRWHLMGRLNPGT